MFRISEERQKSNERVSKAELALLKALAAVGNRFELTAWEEPLVLNSLLNKILTRQVREENP